MSQRHDIMKDAGFWVKLAYGACGWLRSSEDASLRGFWVDDFLPESVINTKQGVEIEGVAYVGEGSRSLQPYRFRLSVPQTMLHRRREGFSIERFDLDAERVTVQVEIDCENSAGEGV